MDIIRLATPVFRNKTMLCDTCFCAIPKNTKVCPYCNPTKIEKVSDTKLRAENKKTNIYEDFDKENQSIEQEVERELQKEERFGVIWNWVWFIITTPIWLLVIDWVVSKAQWPLGILVLLLFLITREIRMRTIGQYQTQTIFAQFLSAQMKSIQRKLGIDPNVPMEKEDQQAIEQVKKNLNRGVIQIWIEYMLIGAMLVLYLFDKTY